MENHKKLTFSECKKQFLALAPKGVGVFEKIKEKMNAPERKIHTFDWLLDGISIYEAQKGVALSKSPGVFFAWLYHYLDFSPFKQRSTEFNEVQFLQDNLVLNLPTPLEEEILSLLGSCNNNKHSTSIINDLDLSILGSSSRTYNNYVAKLEEEFSHIDKAVFNQGRVVVLQTLLGRYYLFNDETLHEKFEKKARTNLNLELDKRLEQFNFSLPFMGDKEDCSNFLKMH